jgi:BNR repeat-like domain
MAKRVSLVLVLMLCVGVIAAASISSSGITIGKNVLVSVGEENIHQEENVLAVSPVDSHKLIACAMNDRAMAKSGYNLRSSAFVSFDGGASWQHAVDAPSSDGTGDPVCFYGTDGTAYFTVISPMNVYDEEGEHTWTLFIYRSPDGGHTWDAPLKTSIGDRPWITVDRTEGPHRGSIYTVSEYRTHPLTGDLDSCAPRCGDMVLRLRRSDDGGRTWPATAIRVATDKNLGLVPLNIHVLSDGTVAIVYMLMDGDKKSALYYTSSHTAGDSLTPPVKITDAPWVNDVESASGSFAADQSDAIFKDRLYVSWVDTTSGRERIMLSVSANKGKTWSSPRPVDDNRTWTNGKHGPDDVMSELAVNRDGVVGIQWYDRRNSGDDIGYTTRFSASLDGGDTWLPSVPIASAPNVFGGIEHWQLLPSGASPKPGDSQKFSILRWEWIPSGNTAGLVTDAGGVFHGLWVDDRTGIKQLYTASAAVSGTVAKNGGGDLAELTDLSSQLTLQSEDVQYDSASGIVTVEAAIKNIGKTAVHGPLKVRVLTLESECAVPEVVDASNGLRGSGAVWDFTKDLHHGVLPPNEETAAMTLRFHLRDLQPFVVPPLQKSGGITRFGLISLDLRILGK